MYKSEKKLSKSFYSELKIFYYSREIIQYAIFTKSIAINNNEIFHVKGKIFLSTINIHIDAENW